MASEKTIQEPPEEFNRVIHDFISDMIITFPEYEGIINKWWKNKTFENIEDEEERKNEIAKDKEKRIQFIFNYCIRVYPERFFDIIYKNIEIFNDDCSINTEFLPGISFKYLWQLDISDSTRDTIWKYLQLIAISIIGSVQNKEAFGNTAKLFDNIDENEFKDKLEETLEKMQELFDSNFQEATEEEGQGEATEEGEGVEGESTRGGMNMPSANDIHNHINNMLTGKIGNLAKEIAEETANDLNIDMENVTDIKGVFQNLFKNPGKLMGMVKNVGDKLDTKIKSGEIKESELIAEASELMSNMKNMPGMGDIQSMLGKMGMGMGGAGKMNVNAMQSQLQRNMKMAQMKERMKNKAQKTPQTQTQPIAHPNALTDEQLISVFSTGEKVEKTPVGAKPTKNKKNKNKNKK
jgi:hypothetical protein